MYPRKFPFSNSSLNKERMADGIFIENEVSFLKKIILNHQLSHLEGGKSQKPMFWSQPVNYTIMEVERECISPDSQGLEEWFCNWMESMPCFRRGMHSWGAESVIIIINQYYSIIINQCYVIIFTVDNFRYHWVKSSWCGYACGWVWMSPSRGRFWLVKKMQLFYHKAFLACTQSLSFQGCCGKCRLGEGSLSLPHGHKMTLLGWGGDLGGGMTAFLPLSPAGVKEKVEKCVLYRSTHWVADSGSSV